MSSEDQRSSNLRDVRSFCRSAWPLTGLTYFSSWESSEVTLLDNDGSEIDENHCCSCVVVDCSDMFFIFAMVPVSSWRTANWDFESVSTN